MSAQIFSMPRFGHVLVHYLISRRKELLLYTLTVMAMISFFIICYLWNLPVNNARSLVFFKAWASIPFWVITLCLCVALASRSFIDMRTVNGMLTEATLPASQFEKFLVRWIVGIPFPVVFCLSLIKAIEVIGYVILTVLLGKTGHETAITFSESLHFSFSWIVAVIWLQSFYFLGAIAQRRYGAIVTLAVIALFILTAAIIWGDNIPLLMITDHRMPLLLCLGGVPVCCYIGAWFFYRRADIR